MSNVKIPESREDLAWAAGLFEGEGCWANPVTTNYPTAAVNSTDLDVLERLQRTHGGTISGPKKRQKAHWKDQWRWQVSGYESIQALGAAWWPWLCERRRARWAEVLLQTRQAHELRQARARFPRFCRSGHWLTSETDEVGRRHECGACRKDQRVRESVKLKARRRLDVQR